MLVATSIVEYLKRNRLVIATAESCTAGKIITLLSEVDGGGGGMYWEWLCCLLARSEAATTKSTRVHHKYF